MCKFFPIFYLMQEGYVYLLCENGDNEMYKIGVTRSEVSKRIKKLQTGNGNPIHCVASFKSSRPYKLEKMLHSRFSLDREEGEWFLLSKEQAEGFLPLCEKLEGIIISLKDNPFF